LPTSSGSFSNSLVVQSLGLKPFAAADVQALSDRGARFGIMEAISKQYFSTSPTSIANLSEVNHSSNCFVFKRIVVLLSLQENGRVGIIFFG